MSKSTIAAILPEPFVGEFRFRGFALYGLERAVNERSPAMGEQHLPWGYEVVILDKFGRCSRETWDIARVDRELGPAFRMGGERWAVLWGSELRALPEDRFIENVARWNAPTAQAPLV